MMKTQWNTVVATRTYDNQIGELLSELERDALETAVALYPEANPMIPNSGGVRKIRWGVDGRGKRGGIRVVYYYVASDGVVFMIGAYAKNVQEDLNQDDLKALRLFVRACKEERRKADAQED